MEKPSYLFDKSLIFSHIPLFADLKGFEKKLIFDSLEIVEVKKSELVYKLGDLPDAFYCIISGRVEVFIENAAGKEEVLERLHRGKYFGFISLLTGEPHSVSARAINDTVLARIPKDEFLAILKNIPRLAIDLSRMLSRRLKRKDLHPKSIFESTIISVYGDEKINNEALVYSLNLSFGLGFQTRKKAVFVEVLSGDNSLLKDMGIGTEKVFSCSRKFFAADEVFNNIIKTKRGFDVLRVSCGESDEHLSASLISLLTLLVNDYHYCVINLAAFSRGDVFKILAQSDAVHVLASAAAQDIKDISRRIYSSGIWSDSEFKKKIKLIILEERNIHGKGPRLTCEQEGALFNQPIFATLPATDKVPVAFDDSFSDPYQRVVRRITRQIGEVLVGLALGSGSAMGLAHIGVIKILESEEIPVDIVSGSSMGALVGALWCSGYSARQVEEIILENKNKRYLFGLDDLTFPYRGLIKGKHIHRFLRKYLKDKTFRNVNKPLRIVACDILCMKQVVFDSGLLVDAVSASISIPGVFEPYTIAGHHYIDGGILDPLPTDVLIDAGAKKIISVNVLPSPEEIERTYEFLNKRDQDEYAKGGFLRHLKYVSKKKTANFLRPNIFDVIVSSVQSVEYSLAQLSSLSQSDSNLHPDMTAISWADFNRAPELIKRGEEEAQLHLREIKELANHFE